MERESYRNSGRRSGLNQTAYYRKQGLGKRSFTNWLKTIGEWEAAKNLDRKRRRYSREPLSRQKQNRAAQAFWAMHVEALHWSGMWTSEYADAHRLPRPQLSRWCQLLETGEVEADWRLLLHPSAWPPVTACNARTHTNNL